MCSNKAVAKGLGSGKTRLTSQNKIFRGIFTANRKWRRDLGSS